jgi:hypothetical protein
MAKTDFHHEISVAQFWRKHLGEVEYVYHNPDDLFRWYEALETRGPDEIRAYIQERSSRFPMTELRGVVSVAPHPPMPIVDLWLKSHEKVRTGPYWTALAALFVLSVILGPNIQGCQNLKSIDSLAKNPVPMNLPPQTSLTNMPNTATSTLPGLPTAPAPGATNPALPPSSGPAQN